MCSSELWCSPGNCFGCGADDELRVVPSEPCCFNSCGRVGSEELLAVPAAASLRQGVAEECAADPRVTPRQGYANEEKADGITIEMAEMQLELASSLSGQNNHAEAEDLLRKTLDQMTPQVAESEAIFITAMSHLGRCLGEQGNFSDAQGVLEKALKLADQHGTAVNKLQILKDLHLCLIKQGKDMIAEREIWPRIQGLSSQAAPRRGRASMRGALSNEVAEFMGDDEVPRLIVISDIGQDNDDEMALLLLAEMYRRDEIQVKAVIANLRPASSRAALARGTLDMVGMKDVPVGIGTDGGSVKHTDTFSKHISVPKTGLDYFSEADANVKKVLAAMDGPTEEQVCKKYRVFPGQKLMLSCLREASDKSIRLLLLSSLKDATLLLKEHENLFARKVLEVTIMGGMNPPDPKLPGEEASFLQPSDAHNNMFDFEASKYLYRRCQELSVPLVVLSRFTAYGCPVQKQVYDLAVRCPVPHPTICRLQSAQRESIETLWQNVHRGGILPPRCDKQWFCDTFCGGNGTDRNQDASMWDLVCSFNMYDPLAVLAALPGPRDLYFSPQPYTVKGVTHLIIGLSKDETGLAPQKRQDLHDYLSTTWIKAAARPAGYIETPGVELLRPKALDSEQLTAALKPMIQRSKEELNNMNKEVLRLIDEEWPKLKNRPTTAGNSQASSTWSERDKFMRSIGPPMMLLDPEMVNRLGRIPHSAENKTITMEQAAHIADFEGKRFFIEMFSHRWHSPYAPDDRWGSKAKVLVEWAKYRNSMKPPLRTFFWVDYCCIDQCDIAPGVAMLPLYVSCCSNILCFDTPPYEPRSWCRVERLMFSAFVAPNNEYVDPDFEYDPAAPRLPNGDLKPVIESKRVVPDPMGIDSQLSYPSDSPLIERLKTLCAEHWAKCWKDSLMDIVEQKVGLKEVRRLQYGVTELRFRKFGSLDREPSSISMS
eukprot:TRINITY_DN13073_c0_g2_i1.p1 TRINITY_DN13073_c0_g2~~TRINITY_DN13073_c0_g2_i1.p1  ORF type:complete len:940 (-),score=185.98 TRINITY_DN13073_c0_g2_i1:67-2886(-)